jgi:hypothetical protein
MLITQCRTRVAVRAASGAPADAAAPQKSNTVAIGLGVVSALLIVGLLIFGWWYIRRRRANQGFVHNAKIDASFAIEEAAPPPLPASELRKLSQRPSLGVITVPQKLTEEALKRNMSTVTRSDASHQPMSPALASSVMEYAPYGAPSRVLQNPASGAKKNRASRSSRYRSLVYGPNTAVTEQSIAELQEELPIPPTPKSTYSTVSTATRNLPPPPPPMPVKEDKPMRVVRASDLPPPPPLPNAAADLVGSSSPLPSVPGAASLQVPANRGGRRLPTLPGGPPSSEAGPSSRF